ncbi:glutathione S-transferase family protein [Sneathiella marina]|uniref:Glutathione S-transferase family protein n=1 Tax=Sneathiella marina TaxID=2950108 RepID=A0ABY4W7R7_9PROT|nr:glutathione S-transferase family protein [Sneathiella marina]USG63093.1 glutathione S-transferase family protein [Sneathiella marina]
MTEDNYILYGSEYSPFSVKVRSYFRYKNIPHEWRPRTHDNLAEFQKLAKLPLVPLVAGPENEVLQDSTPIMELMETRYPEKSICPEDAELSFLSFLLEDYGDEWVNKPMFHYRWWNDADQIAVANGLAQSALPNGDANAREKLAAQIRTRMVPRLRFVGSHEGTRNIIESSFDTLLMRLEGHLKRRPYIFGGRPSFADFGIWGQVYSCMLQPTTKTIILENFPEIVSWIDRMLDPKEMGEWEDWQHIAPTLEPLIKGEIGELYLPWSVANSKAVFEDASDFSVELPLGLFTQQVAKYSARSLQALKDKLSKVEDRTRLEETLLKNNCLSALVAENW